MYGYVRQKTTVVPGTFPGHPKRNALVCTTVGWGSTCGPCIEHEALGYV